MQEAKGDAGSHNISAAHEVAAYVASLARELKALADGHKLFALGYLLDLVRVEAEQQSRGETNRLV